MSEVKKVGSRYFVYDHVMNLTKRFKKKAEADEFAEELKKTNTTQQPQEETLNSTEDVN